jgi:hypothetical protein
MHILIAIVVLILAGIFWRQIIAGLGLFLALGLAGAAVLAVVVGAVWLFQAATGPHPPTQAASAMPFGAR